MKYHMNYETSEKTYGYVQEHDSKKAELISDLFNWEPGKNSVPVLDMTLMLAFPTTTPVFYKNQTSIHPYCTSERSRFGSWTWTYRTGKYHDNSEADFAYYYDTQYLTYRISVLENICYKQKIEPSMGSLQGHDFMFLADVPNELLAKLIKDKTSNYSYMEHVLNIWEKHRKEKEAHRKSELTNEIFSKINELPISKLEKIVSSL